MTIRVSVQSNLGTIEAGINGATEASLEAIGLYVQSEAKTRAPVGQYTDGRVGGNLRSSIEYEVDIPNKTAYVGTDVHYGQYVEEGTSKMAAQPYLVPAVEENLQNIRRIARSQYENYGG